MPIDLNNIALQLGQMLMNHRHMPWNQPKAARAKMAPEAQIVFDLLDELRAKGLSQAPGPDRIAALRGAAQFLAQYGDADPRDVASDPQARKRAFRRAAMKLHPDAGGDPALYRRLVGYNQILEWTEQR